MNSAVSEIYLIVVVFILEEWKEYFEGDDDTYVPVDQPE